MFIDPNSVWKIINHLYPNEKVKIIDVGGGIQPFPGSYTILDIRDRRREEEKFGEFLQRDVIDTPYCYSGTDASHPVPGNYYDFSVCSHTLEDIRDPIRVAAELKRISKAGYIEIPHRLTELSKGVSCIHDVQGWSHHMWLYDVNGHRLQAYPKSSVIVKYIEPGNYKRGLGYFWTKDTVDILVHQEYLLNDDNEWVNCYKELAGKPYGDLYDSGQGLVELHDSGCGLADLLLKA